MSDDFSSKTVKNDDQIVETIFFAKNRFITKKFLHNYKSQKINYVYVVSNFGLNMGIVV